MRTNRLMMSSNLQTAGEHISVSAGTQCRAQWRGHSGHQSVLFFQNGSWYGHLFKY